MITEKQNDLISVIVPVFNGHDYLRQCVQSVLAQTHKNLQVILVDDASTDDSLSIANGFAANDDRVTVIARPANGGQSAARNTGLEAAKGT